MTPIEVRVTSGWELAVQVGGHRFTVTADRALVEDLGAPDAAALARASFAFLLDREPAASILPSFDLTVIERYFPGWRASMRQRFRPGPQVREPRRGPR
jgi:hypothetical protein